MARRKYYRKYIPRRRRNKRSTNLFVNAMSPMNRILAKIIPNRSMRWATIGIGITPILYSFTPKIIDLVQAPFNIVNNLITNLLNQGGANITQEYVGPYSPELYDEGTIEGPVLPDEDDSSIWDYFT